MFHLNGIINKKKRKKEMTIAKINDMKERLHSSEAQKLSILKRANIKTRDVLKPLE